MGIRPYSFATAVFTKLGSLLSGTSRHCSVLVAPDVSYGCFSHSRFQTTVVPVMNGHPGDQAKVSVHERWPLIAGTGGRRQT